MQIKKIDNINGTHKECLFYYTFYGKGIIKVEELLAKAEELKKLLDEINDAKEKFLDGIGNEEAQKALKYAIDFKTNSCLRYLTFKVGNC